LRRSEVQEKDKDVSIINKGCTVNGNLNFKGYLIVEGTVEGILNAESVTTEERSFVKADVTSEKLTIAGRFEGNIIVTGILTLLGTSNVQGTIHCNSIVVEEGGILNGTVTPFSSSAIDKRSAPQTTVPSTS